MGNIQPDLKFPDRHKYMGPSEAAIACGLSPYKTRRELWLEKTLRRARTATSPVMERGNWMEPLLISRLVNEHDISIICQQDEFTETNRPHLRGHVDGIIPNYTYIGEGYALDVIQSYGPGVCEIKAPGSRMAQKFSKEGLTPDYIFQAQLYMHLTKTKWTSLFYLDYDSNEMKQIDIVRNDGFIEKALAMVDNFWLYVTNDEEPPEVPVLEVPGPSELHSFDIPEPGLAEAYLNALDMVEDAKLSIESVTSDIKREMTENDASTLTVPGITFTWKPHTRRTLEKKPLLQWTEAVCAHLIGGRLEEANRMAHLFATESELFYKTGVTRPFRKKVHKDESDED